MKQALIKFGLALGAVMLGIIGGIALATLLQWISEIVNKERVMGATTERIDTKMPLECGDCGTRWDEHFSLPMDLDVFVKKGKAIACPKCGSQKIYLLPKGAFYVPDKQ